MVVLLLHGHSPGRLGCHPKVCAAADPWSIGGQADPVAVAVNQQTFVPRCADRGQAVPRALFATILRRIDRLRGPLVEAA
jgi:hypothetical protein